MTDFRQLSRSVKGLTVLVTGAASGMGRATARVFAAEGANVAVTEVSTQGVKSIASEIATSGGTAKAWTLDVADRAAITDVVNDVAAHFGGLDIVINNAGISVRVAIDDEGYDEAWTRGRYHDAARLFLSLIEAPHFPEWLTIPAYEKIIAEGA